MVRGGQKTFPGYFIANYEILLSEKQTIWVTDSMQSYHKCYNCKTSHGQQSGFPEGGCTADVSWWPDQHGSAQHIQQHVFTVSTHLAVTCSLQRHLPEAFSGPLLSDWCHFPWRKRHVWEEGRGGFTELCDTEVAGRCNHRMIEPKSFSKWGQRCLWKYEFIYLQPAPLLFPFAVLRYVFTLMLTSHHRYHKSAFFIKHISACFMNIQFTQNLNIVDWQYQTDVIQIHKTSVALVKRKHCMYRFF